MHAIYVCSCILCEFVEFCSQICTCTHTLTLPVNANIHAHIYVICALCVYEQDRLANIFMELGAENGHQPLPLTVLLEHPVIQDLVYGCTAYKAIVSSTILLANKAYCFRYKRRFNEAGFLDITQFNLLDIYPHGDLVVSKANCQLRDLG